MANYITQVLDWSHANKMNVNWKKTKQMTMGSLASQSLPDFIVDGHNVERVYTFKLLGLYVDDNLKWNSHVNAICARASSRLYFLKQLKRSGVNIRDLLQFYVSVIRPILEYACPAWHTSLTVEHNNRIEAIQRRAVKIIYGPIVTDNYINLCKQANLPRLAERREMLCKTFFNSMLNKQNCLNYLLPEPRDQEILGKLRQSHAYVAPTTRTVHFQKSFIIHALSHYQTPCINA
jgi:hypothetical protein